MPDEPKEPVAFKPIEPEPIADPQDVKVVATEPKQPLPENIQIKRLAGGELAAAEDVTDRINNFVTSAREEASKQGFLPEDIDAHISVNPDILLDAGFTRDDISTYKAMRQMGYPGEMYQANITGTDKGETLFTPKDFWNLSPEERHAVRTQGELGLYFGKGQEILAQQGEIRAIERSTGITSQIIQNFKTVLFDDTLERQERFNKALTVLAPAFKMPTYLAFKAVNGKVLFAGDIFWAAANRLHEREFGEPLTDIKLEEQLLQDMDYNPSGLTEAVGDILEFITSLGAGKSMASNVPKGATVFERATRMGGIFIPRGVGKGIVKVIESEGPPAAHEFSEEVLKEFLLGYTYESVIGYGGKIGKTKAAKWAIDHTRKIWKKGIDVSVDKLKAASDSSLVGKFRNTIGEHIVPFYKRPKQFVVKYYKTLGEKKLREAEVRGMLEKFHKATKDIQGWASDLASKKQMHAVMTGKAKLESLPKEVQGWVAEAMEMRRQSSLELAAFWRRRGKERLADAIEKNADKYLPRKYRAHEAKDGLWDWLFKRKKPEYGGGEFKIRKDKWTVWEGNIATSKHQTYAGAEEKVRYKATQAIQAKIDTVEQSISVMREQIAETPTAAKNSKLMAMLKQSKGLQDRKAQMIKKADTLLAEARKTLLGVPGELPPVKEASINIAGTRIKIKPPLSTEEMEALGIIDDPLYLWANAMMKGKQDIENKKLLDYIGKKWGRTGPEGFKVKDLKQWADDLGLSRVPDASRFGELAGKYVPKGIAKDLGVIYRDKPGLVSRLYRAYLGVWKESKVVWNPATHGRNVMGNFIFSDFAGNSVMNPKNYNYYRDGMKSLIEKDQHWKNLVKHNVIGTEYYGVDIKPALVELEKQGGNRILEGFVRASTSARAKAGHIYAMEDQVFKAAAYLKYLSKGMTPTRAAREVNRWFPNYETISPLTRVARTSPLGAPFMSFTDQAVKIAGRASREHPLKVAKWAALPGAMTEFSQWYLGISPGEKEVIDTNRGYFEPIIPWRDEQGRVNTWDMKWTIPLANDIVPDIKRYGIDVPWALSSPFVDAAVQLLSGRDAFTGRAIAPEDASKGKKILNHAIEGALTLAPIPSIAQFGPKRIVKAMMGEGRESTERAIAGVLVGINVRAPYIVRQELYTDIREDIMSAEPDRYIMAIEKMVIFNNTYKTEEQPYITFDGLNRSIMYQNRKEILEILEEK